MGCISRTIRLKFPVLLFGTRLPGDLDLKFLLIDRMGWCSGFLLFSFGIGSRFLACLILRPRMDNVCSPFFPWLCSLLSVFFFVYFLLSGFLLFFCFSILCFVFSTRRDDAGDDYDVDDGWTKILYFECDTLRVSRRYDKHDGTTLEKTYFYDFTTG